jgi:hypothetical protein
MRDAAVAVRGRPLRRMPAERVATSAFLVTRERILVL